MQPSEQSSAGPASFVPNDVHVVDKSYLLKSFASKEWQRAIDDVSLRFHLNKEQNHAFRIVANHSCSPDSSSLRMYIGGMAGTGKSQVLKALLDFFSLKKESHRLVVVAPTGSAAALLVIKCSTCSNQIKIDGSAVCLP